MLTRLKYPVCDCDCGCENEVGHHTPMGLCLKCGVGDCERPRRRYPEHWDAYGDFDFEEEL